MRKFRVEVVYIDRLESYEQILTTLENADVDGYKLISHYRTVTIIRAFNYIEWLIAYGPNETRTEIITSCDRNRMCNIQTE